MGPAVGEPKRGEFLSWLAYRAGVMEPAFIERRAGFQHVQGMMGWASEPIPPVGSQRSRTDKT